MARGRMPDGFFEAIAHHSPPIGPSGPEGDRPRIGHRVRRSMLATGSRGEDVAGLGRSGQTARLRLRAQEEPASGAVGEST